jgi:hypothetical protein
MRFRLRGFQQLNGAAIQFNKFPVSVSKGVIALFGVNFLQGVAPSQAEKEKKMYDLCAYHSLTEGIWYYHSQPTPVCSM